MAVPIIFIYVVGVIFFIVGIEYGSKGNIYLGLSFFVNLMGYYLSYSNMDYVQAAYLPLILIALTVLVLLYNAWNLIPVENWDMEADAEED